jgi:uncharacterized Ntn-hydrolase superfamily protein
MNARSVARAGVIAGMEVNTFSVVARCPRTGQLGVAVSTAVPAVGSICPFVRSEIGAVSTQSWVNPYLALEALRSIETGASAQQALDAVLAADDARNLRQVGIVDHRGRSAAWSGPGCTPWFGHCVGEHYAVQGNMLTGPDVIASMSQAMRASEDLDLAERLMRALEAGQAAGGDKRGRQSAALRVHEHEEYPLLDLRVDEHAYPVGELRRVYEIARLQLLPFVRGMPKRGELATAAPASVTSMLALSPPFRPGGGGSAL